MKRPALTAFNSVATAWFIPTSMLAFIRDDAPGGWAMLILAGTCFTYACRQLTEGRVRRHNG